MLQVEDLVASYDEVVALKGVSLEVREGEVVALIGANGAGKTTMLRVLSGLLPARRGTVVFRGKVLNGWTPDGIVGLGLVHIPEGRHIFPLLTVEGNLLVAAHLIPQMTEVRRSLDRVFQLFPRLAERRRQHGGTLSGGEQQMLAFGRALMANPRLIQMDEPSLGLAPILVEEVANVIARFRDEGITVLLVEQNARLALSLADRGYVIEAGEIVLSDSAENLLMNPSVQASYLGGSGARQG
ncbi:MAG TPA: ABC transporter ATP-binding protein [Candidatus Methylomirabilis sp.]|nr:ABC transporter ATP-binding protein [Candidatus Methylomirabilis sp.]